MLFLNTSLSLTSFRLSRYKPYINYDWSTTTASGLRYLKDVGSTPTYNASMYFGRGAYLNGVDQTITVPINTTIQTALKRVNGVVTINETSQILTNYVISGLGVHKDYYLFTRLLTTAEKDSYTNTPELFYAMAQADSTCVLNMPMCETDGYVRNMKSYSEGNELLVNFNTHTDNSAWIGGLVTNQPDGFTKIEYGAYTNSVFYLREINSEFLSDLIVGDKYYIDAEVKTDSTLCYPDISGLPATGPLSNAQGVRRITAIITASLTNSNYIRAYCDTNNRNVYWKINTIKKLSGIHQITNYTTSVRYNAKNLQYGLQTCKFVRDGLGVIQSGSDYLEGDGVGYGDTGWIPSADEDCSIEFITYAQPQEERDEFLGLFGSSVPSDYATQNFFMYAHKSYDHFWTLKVGVNVLYSAPEIRKYNYWTIIFNSLTKEVTMKIANTNQSITTITNFTGCISSFLVGRIQRNYVANVPTRLFKVHNKVLTQAEITANYNSYRAKGLLS